MIEFKNLSIYYHGHKLLSGVNWQLADGESVSVLGGNGSGKSSICRALQGQADYRGDLLFSGLDRQDIAVVSYEEYKALMDWDNRFDDSECVEGGKDFGRSVFDILSKSCDDEEEIGRILERFSMSQTRNTGLRYISSGESRKLVLARALLQKPKLLILDSPFDALDKESTAELKELIAELLAQGQQIILFIRSEEEAFEGFDKEYSLDQGQFSIKETLLSHERKDFTLPESLLYKAELLGEDLVSMKGVKVSYQGREILSDVNWQLKQGEHWRLSGANGCGKSTLLSLVTGDNSQAYGQDLYLFGRKRGTGESIWDIKKNIALVNTEIQQKLQQRIKAFEVVVSGFFDSIGLFEAYNQDHKIMAEAWMDLLEIEDLHEKYFHELSFGEQRLLLIARALVKKPKLLILDEPCQGIDDFHRESILRLLEAVVKASDVTLLYVSHVDEAELSFIDHEMKL